MLNSEESCHSSHKTTMQHPVKAWTGQPYPAYKDSGVEWLGKVPEHWNLQRIATAADIRFSSVDKHTKEGEHPVRLCNYVDVYHNEKINSDIPFMAGTAKREEIRKFRLEVGDVLVTKDSEDWKDIGVPALVEYAADDLVCGYHLAILRPNEESLDGGYLSYALKDLHVAWQCQVAAVGVTRYGLSQNAIKSVRIPLPPLPEQYAIAHFLDHAKQRIQHHIHAKEKLIKLLEEQKQVIIHQAVTGQIDVRTGQPYPAYKDSGVEWLGKVPEHWEVPRVKQATRILRGKFTHRPRNDPALYGGPYPFVQTGDVARAEKNIQSYSQTLNETGRSISRIFPAGTLVMAIAANIGDVAVLDFDACFPDSVVGFVPGTEARRDYLYYLFMAMKPELVRDAPVNTQGNLNVDRLGSQRIPLPSCLEQDCILQQIDAATSNLNSAIGQVRDLISLLHEYRTRLIADVVTGKLDVRKAAAELPGHEPSTTDNACQDGMALAAQVWSRHP